jgi:cytochrome c-type biogenesis protein CcmH/NrfG
MKDRASRKIIHSCVLLAILGCMPAMGRLTWVDCVRMLAILVVLAVPLVRQRRSVFEGESLPGGPTILALGVAFIVTQFDPVILNLALLQPLAGLSYVSVVTSLLGLAAGLMAIVTFPESLRWSRLSLLDLVCILVVAGIAILTVVSRVLAGSPTTQSEVLVTLKVISLGGWWIAVTRAYGDGHWTGGHPVLGKWVGPLLLSLILILPTAAYGGYRLWAVVHSVAQGREAFEAGQWDRVKEYFETVSSANLTVGYAGAREGFLADPTVQQKVADVYLASEQWSEAADLYERVLENGPNPAVHDALGLAYVRLRDARSMGELTDRLNQLPALDVKAFDDVMFLGDVMFSRQTYGSAHDFYKAAADIRPDDAEARFKVGRAWFEQGYAKHAIRQFQRSVKLDPGFAEAHYHIGVCLEVMGDTAAAISIYEKAVNLKPDHLDAKRALGRLR